MPRKPKINFRTRIGRRGWTTEIREEGFFLVVPKNGKLHWQEIPMTIAEKLAWTLALQRGIALGMTRVQDEVKAALGIRR